MVFFVTIPIFLCGFGNWLIPIIVNVSSMAFPRLGYIAFWLLPVSFLLINGAVLWETLIGKSWAVNLAIIGLCFLMISIILTSVNLVYTMLKLRAKNISLRQLPIFMWLFLIVAIIIILLCFLVPVVFVFESTLFFSFGERLSPSLCQNFIWFFGNLAIFISILPCFGVVSHILKAELEYPILWVFSITILNFLVWVYFVYVSSLNVGIPLDIVKNVIGITTIIANVYSAKLLVALLRKDRVLEAPELFCLAFIYLFIFSTNVGIVLLYSKFNTAFYDNYCYLIAHFYYLLLVGSILSMFGGVYYWFTVIAEVTYNKILSQIHFWLFFIGVNVVFFPVHFLVLTQTHDCIEVFHMGTKIISWGLNILKMSFGVFCLLLFEALTRKKN